MLKAGFSTTVKKIAASTIGSDLVLVQPMGSPNRTMSYMDFQFVSPWVEKYEHIPGAIRVKIKDTFDNILNLIENPDIIIASILEFKIDVQFVKDRALWRLYRSTFGNNMLGLTDAQINYFNVLNSFGIVDQNPKNIQSGLCISEQYPKIERDTLIEFDAIIYAPLTKFVKRNAIANHEKPYWKEDLLVDYTCKRLIDDIFRTKRGCQASLYFILLNE